MLLWAGTSAGRWARAPACGPAPGPELPHSVATLGGLSFRRGGSGLPVQVSLQKTAGTSPPADAPTGVRQDHPHHRLTRAGP